MKKKILGILGGMGPAASARFYALLTEFTAAEKDGDHMEILIYSLPSIPDRTEFILGQSELSPLPMMKKAILGLKKSGAEVIAVPCNTAEYFCAEISAACPVPILRASEASVQAAKKRGVRKLGVLATEGALRARIYQERLSELGIDFALPSRSMQAEINALIYSRIKKSLPDENRTLERAAREFRADGCDAAILGCTELSLAAPEVEPRFFIDSLSALAAAGVRACGYPLSEKGKTHLT